MSILNRELIARNIWPNFYVNIGIGTDSVIKCEMRCETTMRFIVDDVQGLTVQEINQIGYKLI